MTIPDSNSQEGGKLALSDEQLQRLWDEACKDSPAKPGWCRHLRFGRAVLAAGASPTPSQEGRSQPEWLDEAMKLAEDYARAWQHDASGEYLLKDQATSKKAALRTYLAGAVSSQEGRSSLSVEGWQPIETAPRDGSPVLLKPVRGKGLLHPFVGRFMRGSEDWSFAAPVGFGGIDDELLDGWMPLPNPPEQA